MKKSANPAAIIGGILSIVVALSWGAVNVVYGDMLVSDAVELIQFMLSPFLFLVLAVFLFIGKPRVGVPIVMTILLLCSLLVKNFITISTHTLYLFLFDGKLYRITKLNRLFLEFWHPVYLLALLAFVVLGFLMVSGKGRMLWFLPPALATLSSLMVIFILLGQMELNEGDFHLPFTILSEVVRTGALWCAARFMAGPGPVMSAAGDGGQGTYGAGGYMAYRAEGYVDLMSCALLLLFTLGIYHLVWIYRTTRYLNRVEGALSRNPTTKLLLCMFIPFYTIYWTYQSAQRVDALARSKGLYAELTSPCVLLSIFAGIVPPMLMQNTINAISQTEAPGAAAPGAEETQSAPAAMPAAPVTGQGEEDVIEALKRYKELLDQGVITQEEFDRKKAQLLGQ